MKKSYAIIFLALIIVSTALAGAILDYFHVTTESDYIKLEWKTTTETNLASFIVERKTPDTQFTDLVTISPKGNNSVYTYIDQAAYKTTNPVFIYRIRIVDTDGSYAHSSIASASPNISGVKRTWGSIKAMFR